MKKKKTRRATRAFYAGLSYLSPRWNTKLLYLRKFGRLPDLKHPQTLNEKLLKQKLERFGELTFTPAAALDNKRLPETDLRFGRRMEETL